MVLSYKVFLALFRVLVVLDEFLHDLHLIHFVVLHFIGRRTAKGQINDPLRNGPLIRQLLEPGDEQLKFRKSPVVQIIAPRLRLDQSLLKLLRIVILLNDLLEEVVLLRLLVLHCLCR